MNSWIIVISFIITFHIETIFPSSLSSIDSIPRLVLFSFDGFRPDYITPETPNLLRISKMGVTSQMISTFVTKTFPNHQTIVTGLYEPYHGIINNQFTDPLSNGSFNVNDPSPFWWDQFNRTLPIYIANQLFDSKRFSGAVQWPGTISTYTDGQDPSRRYNISYLIKYDPNMNWITMIDQVIDTWLLRSNNPANFLLIYLQEPDATSHIYGPFSEEVKSKIWLIDEIVGHYIERIEKIPELNDSLNTLFVSDHGMSEIAPDRWIFLNRCDHEYHGLRYELYGVSPVYSIVPISCPNVWSNCNDVAVGVRDALNLCSKQFYDEKFTVYLQKDIPDEYHYKNNRRILPIFLLADDGYQVEYDKQYERRGNHGFNNTLESMKPLFIGIGPRFKHRYRHETIIENVDLFPLMLELLKMPIKEYKSNGSFHRVRSMLEYTYNIDSYELADEFDERKTIFSSIQQEKTFIIELAIFLTILILILFLGFGICISRLNQSKNRFAWKPIIPKKPVPIIEIESCSSRINSETINSYSSIH